MKHHTKFAKDYQKAVINFKKKMFNLEIQSCIKEKKDLTAEQSNFSQGITSTIRDISDMEYGSLSDLIILHSPSMRMPDHFIASICQLPFIKATFIKISR